MPKMVFDSSLCVGCYACENACRQWHDKGPLEDGFRVVEKAEQGTFPQVTRTFVSKRLPGCDACFHCAEVCPTGALSLVD